ncbi:MAG: iron-sulfur cluster assembly scaffold protein [Candidatus Aenigmarchaeota archaeon]|nr:iron-sulfur cluster assembly scaffold protein [Candidatus Aenigmarchaeota archaeon]
MGGDVQTGENEWFYSEEVKEHFFSPKNIFTSEEEAKNYTADGEGMVGSPACGDVMRMWIKVDPKTDRIRECKWRTFGCASALASTSMLSVMVTENGGIKIVDALRLKPGDIIKRLGGLPARKIHCSVLGDKALRAAINDYFKKSGQFSRVLHAEGKIIDPEVNVSDEDIEHAVLEGARTIEDLQKRLKVGIHNKDVLPKVKELIAYYRKKHFGE